LILVGVHRRFKKTWVDIPNVGQKGVIQYGVQDNRRTLICNITPFGICLGVINLVSLPRFLRVKESTEIILRVKKVAGKGEFQNGRQNGEKKKLTNVSTSYSLLTNIQN